tara:strand:+ start:402 stop:518 length:117 start_codon:yes stop_codon:yes gene_type:complete
MNNLINPEEKNRPSNCVSYHDDICFADNYHGKEESDQD